MRVLFICGREPAYARNKVICKALRENGVSLICCVSSASTYVGRYLSVVSQFFLTPPWRYDAILVGFFGQPLVLVVKPYAWLFRKPILFDAFVSAYDTMVGDRGVYRAGSFSSGVMFWLDKSACSLSDHVLLDTNQNIRYWVNTFGLPEKKFSRTFFGADDALFFPGESGKTDGRGLLVEFHGGFQPLQGISTILNAANLLKDCSDIRFQLIGDGLLLESMKDFSEALGLRNVEFVGRVAPHDLRHYVENCDVGLGIFGTSRKALCTIPNKAFEIIACAKPLVTANTDAARELFEDRKTAFLVTPGKAEELASILLELRSKPALRHMVGNQGRSIFEQHATASVLGRQVKEVLWKIIRLRRGISAGSI